MPPLAPVDNQRLPGGRLEMFGEQARGDVARAAGCERTNDFGVASRVVGSAGGRVCEKARAERQRRSTERA